MIPVLFKEQHLNFHCQRIVSTESSAQITDFFVWVVFLFVLFCLLSRVSYLSTLDVNSLSVTSLANVFFQFIGCLFIFQLLPFAVQNLLSVIMSHLFILTFNYFALGDGSKKVATIYVKE